MGINDWKNKEPDNYTAEDYILAGAEYIPHGNFICLSFYWGQYRFDIWECWQVYLYDRDEFDKTKYLEHVDYEDCESMMLDRHWDGLTLSDIMSKIPESELFAPPSAL